MFLAWIITNIKYDLAIREDRTSGGSSTYQCSYTLPAGVASGGPLPGAAINTNGPNTSSASPSSSSSPSAAFASATLANLSNNNSVNGNGPSSLPTGLPSGGCANNPEDNMELSHNKSLPPNITEGPPPLEQTAPVSLTTKSNVPALLKVGFHSYSNITSQ